MRNGTPWSARSRFDFDNSSGANRKLMLLKNLL
jgi:hypothetical protein